MRVVGVVAEMGEPLAAACVDLPEFGLALQALGGGAAGVPEPLAHAVGIHETGGAGEGFVRIGGGDDEGGDGADAPLFGELALGVDVDLVQAVLFEFGLHGGGRPGFALHELAGAAPVGGEVEEAEAGLGVRGRGDLSAGGCGAKHD